jgi:hypothetical protein
MKQTTEQSCLEKGKIDHEDVFLASCSIMNFLKLLLAEGPVKRFPFQSKTSWFFRDYFKDFCLKTVHF